MDPTILKSMIEGVHLSVYAAIKPGAIHRLRLDKRIEYYVSNTIAAINHIIDAIEYGEKIRRGDLAATSLGLGRLLSKGLREAYRWLPNNVYPSFIVPQIIYSLAISHSDIDSIIKDHGKLVRSLDLFISTTSWKEIKYFIDALKGVHREDMYEHLSSAGISHIAGIGEGVSFRDVFRVLGSKWYAFISLDTRESKTYEYVKKLLDYYRKFRDANNAIIALYLEMIMPRLPSWAKPYVEEAFKEGLMASRVGSKKLFELDLKLRKHGVSFNEYVGLLGIITGLAVYEGLRA
ncbi:hypothetical protein [Staphylothermus hellenicus]|uniref:Triphosphoribosyl-dephospho-CoA protein n=1 Tax=Staphylothermus hellenicus (strain DSM 12710 / JCM 10830 / BK20S6-10-b1 / P8) TaxID=591019 RepID=D7DAK0_STAHD|nr:hypothetical protein [Staphylothermus hellenicus]ADI31197.1 hypothetical protein Shell_0047 [Staphylothermus hellenicus DSM 12710]